jgi:flagellar motor switch protein FliG
MANLDQISPEVAAKIATVIESKLQALGEVSREAHGGVRAVAEMLNRMDSATSKEVLEMLEQDDPNLVEGIRNLMFVFEDMLRLGAAEIAAIVPKIDKKILATALKGTSEQMRDHLLSAMSQRSAEMLREDMDALGPIRIRDVETAQQQIIALVRKLESEGVVSLKASAGEVYVV